jgi:hypothetical protein
MGCRKLCGLTYANSTASACNSDLNCMYDSAIGVCTKVCDRYTVAEAPGSSLSDVLTNCRAQSMCAVNGNTCTMKCQYKYTTETDCTGDDYCTWDPLHNACTRACEFISDLSQCSISAVCEWNFNSSTANNCRLQCKFRYMGVDASLPCSNDPECAWNSAQGVCQKACTYYEKVSNTSAQALCQQDVMCFWDPSKAAGQNCVFSCKAKYDYKGECVADTSCMWDTANGVCFETCARLTDSTTCNSLPENCNWVSTRTPACKLRCSLRGYITRGACEDDPECQWHPILQVCSRACDNYPDSTQCTTDRLCEWRTQPAAACGLQCDYVFGRDACFTDTACTWNNTDLVCQRRCQTRHNTPQPCNDDGQCMWSPAETQCRANCWTFTPAVCALDNMCFINQDGTCSQKCYYLYKTEATCDGDYDCEWDYYRNQCDRKCLEFESKADCQTSVMCQWQGSYCEQMCPYRHGNATNCNRDTQCVWSAIQNVCRNSCDKSDNKGACESSALCRWDNESTTCQTKCQLKYSDLATCTADHRCMWDTLNTVCMEACDQVLSLQSCAGIAHMCRWDTPMSKCDKLCRYRYNYTKIPQCNADPECTWSLGGCKRRCTKITDGASCLADSDCEYDDKIGACMPRCSIASPSDCLANPLCDLTTAGTCYKKCSYQYNTQGSCDSAAQCMWNPTTQTCNTACNQLYLLADLNTTIAVSSACAANTMCRLNSSSSPQDLCRRICEFRHVTQSGCDGDVECSWDKFSLKCARACPALSFTECSGASMCDWNTVTGKCQLQCQFAYNSPAPCNAAAGCLWSNVNYRCQPSCSRHVTIAGCNADRLCQYDTNTSTCGLKCSIQYAGNQAGCLADYRCMWDQASSMCRKTCAYITVRGECAVYDMCVWRDNQQCTKVCEFLYLDVNSCNADNVCKWDPSTGICGGACDFRPDQATCNAQTNCIWNVAQQRCGTRCRLRGNTSACTANPNCIIGTANQYSSTLVCKEICQLRYTDPTACGNDPSCMFSLEANQCVPACGTLSQGQCDQSDLCVSRSTNWSSSVTTCEPRCLYKYQTRAGCDMDVYCKWDNIRSVCDSMCAYVTSQSACSANTMCQWNGTCIWRCEYRHTNTTNCAKDPTCLWNQYQNICLLNCGTVASSSTCEMSSTCEWKNTTSKCVNSCGITYSNDNTGCAAAAPACMVNPVKDTCIKTCERIYSSTECLSNADVCRWSPTAQNCVTRCSVAATTQAACSATGGCMWLNGALPAAGSTSLCKRDCGSVGSQLECMSATDCEWLNNKCNLKCELYEDSECVNHADRCRFNYVGGLASNPYGCTRRCSLKYLDAASCNGDQQCMFVSATGECREACSQYQVAQYPGTVLSQVRDLCYGDAQCRFSTGSQTCRQRCEYAHTQESSCAADAECVWDSTNYRCSTHCILLSTLAECSANPMCSFDRSSGMCQVQCKYRFPDSTTCAQATTAGESCQWSTQLNQCVSNCGGLSATQCVENTLCQWWTANASSSGSCMSRCSVAYSDATSCNADAAGRCIWDFTQSLCKLGCAFLTVESDCSAVGGVCEWVATRRVCQKRCEAIATTQNGCSNAAIDITSRCSWDADMNACRRRCNMTLLQGTCLSDSKCYWDPLNRACSTQCEKTPLTECSANQRCVLRDWGMGNVQCLIAPEIRDSTATACVNDPLADTMWDASKLICRTECHYLDTADCSTNSMCRITLAGNCTRRCFYKYSNEYACDADAECSWDVMRAMCSETCPRVASSIECDALATCQWRNGGCADRCELQYPNKNNASCTADSYCQINSLTNACENTCSKHIFSMANVTLEACGADPFCLTSANNTCTPGCQLLGLFSCNANPNCIWDASVDSCFQTCSQLPSAVACAAQSRVCTYNDATRQCKIQCRLKYKTQADCSSDSSECMWDSVGGFCKPACGRYGSSATCLGTPECEWVNYRCSLQCNLRTTAACAPSGESRCTVRSPFFNGMTQPTTMYCDLSCGAKYGNQPTCVADAACQWSATMSVCIRSCQLVAFQAGSVTAAQASACVSESGCTWMNDTSICIPTCSEAYSEPAGCGSNTNCYWDSLRSVCSEKCSILTAPTSCSASSQCVWTSATTTCQLQCAYRHTTPDTCIADTACTWNTTTGLCMPSCASGTTTSAACQTSSACAFNQDTNTCQQTCEARCFTMECCQAWSDCRFDAISGQCKRDCASRSARDCALVPGICNYNPVTTSCIARCDVAYGQNVLNCNNDKNCMYDYNNDVCTGTCTLISSDVECSRQALCSWDPTTSKCRKTCQQNIQKSDCLADPTCEFLSARTPTCNKKCIVQYAMSSDCKADSYCMWDPTAVQCVPTCNYLPPSACLSNFLCGFDANTLECKQLCKYRWQDNATCSADAECMWDTVHVKCAGLCGTLMASEPLCLTSDVCEWTMGGCERQCIYKFQTEAQCIAPGENSTQSCKWNPYRNQCENTCANYEREITINLAQAACNSDPFCEYDNTNFKCNKRCAQMGLLDCNQNTDRCMWDTESGTCKTTCSVVSLQAICDMEAMCLWTSVGCVTQCNFRFTDATSCRNATECSWDSASGVCVSSCANVLDPIACSTRPQCRYDTKQGLCAPRCTVMGQTTCDADPSCNWDNRTQSCSELCVAKYTSQTTCSADARCQWDPSSNQCRRKCQDYTSGNVVPKTDSQAQQECLTAEMCDWLPGVNCTMKCSYAYTTSTACDADSNCQWDSSRDMCGTKCSLFMVKDGCVFSPQCRWNVATSTCISRCSRNSPPQAQCTAATCMWDASNGRCVDNCGVYPQRDNCTYDPLCTWTGSSCAAGCEIQHFDEFSCAADGNCVWDPVNIICRRECSTFRTAECLQLPSICSYNATSLECFTRCSIVHQNQSSCFADARCLWDPTTGNGVCTESCSLTNTMGDCNARPICEWNDQGARCRRTCPTYTNTSDCLENPLCEWRNGVCQKQCAFKYKVPQACAADSACMWNVNLQTCQPACAVIARQAECQTIASCAWSTHNTPTSAGACLKTCQARYSDAIQCNNDTDCVWDDQRLQCTTICGLINGAIACTGEPRCMFVSSTCASRCHYAHNTPTSCDSDTARGCMWNNFTSDCEQNCVQYTTASQCTASSVCELIRSNSGKIGIGSQGYTCNKTCESTYFDFWSCNEFSNNRCAWDRVSQSCRRQCGTIGNYGECQEAQNCVWDQVARGCTVRCQYAADCNARSDCTVDRNTGVCKQTCDVRTSVTNCESDGDCYWDSKNTQCRQRCEVFTTSHACQQSSSCSWNVNTITCQRHCSLTYLVPGTCNADPRCMWDSNSYRCETACSYVYVDMTDSLSQSLCSAISMCQLNAAGNQCLMRCQYRTSQATACTTYGDCMWNPVGVTCDTNCKTVTDMNVCRAMSMCSPDVQTGSTCVPNCPVRWSTPQTCEFDPSQQCIWNALTGFCQNGCSRHRTEASCAADVMCNASGFAGPGGSCAPTCETSGYTNKYTCTASGNCMWDGTNAMCVTPCASTPSQIECLARKDICEWNNEFLTCATKCSLKYSNLNQCNGDPFCMWDPRRGNCTQACSAQPSEGACESMTLCQWRSLTNKCTKSCLTYVAAADCAADNNCQWNGNASTCATKCAYRYFSNVPACVADAECMWDSSEGVCAKTCDLYMTQTQCSAEIGSCEWANGKCSQKCAQKYATAATCGTEPNRCVWNSTIMRCNTRCSAIVAGNEGACTSNPQCMYSNGQCFDRCPLQTNQNTCTSITGCAWNGVCTYDCTLTSTCAVASTCTMQGSTCAVGCSALYFTPQDCASSNNTCQWDPNLGICKTACALQSEALCAYDDMCTNFNGNCGLNCNLKYTSATACDNDPQSLCMWNAGRSFCETRCNVYSKETQCNTADQCVYLSNLGLCRRLCSLTPLSQCQTNEQCWIDNGVCSEQCYYRWGANGVCNQDPDCEWSANSQACGPRRCIATNSSICTMDVDHCQWNLTLSRCQRLPCTWTDQLSCQGDGTCEWEFSNLTCRVKLCPYGTSSATACNGVRYCQMSGGVPNVCVRKCDYYYTLDECESDTRCDWAYDGYCTQNCESKYRDVDQCNADPNCIWDVNQCTRGCSKVTNGTDCSGPRYNAVCVWKDNTCMAQCQTRYGYTTSTPNQQCLDDPQCELYTVMTNDGPAYTCGEPCSQFQSKTNCTAGSTGTYCLWLNDGAGGGSCTAQCKNKYHVKQICVADSNCFWNDVLGEDGQCDDRCEVQDRRSTQADCLATSECTWNEVSSSCVTQCYALYQEEAACWADPNCGWNPTAHSGDGQCMAGCGTLNAIQCEIAPYTAFCMILGSGASKTCTRSCNTLYTNEADCTSSPVCEWNTLADVCQKAICIEPTPLTCAADPRCQWIGASSMCVKKCAQFITPEGCATNPNCFFNTSCAEMCEYRSASSCAAAADWGGSICALYPLYPAGSAAPTEPQNCYSICSMFSTPVDCLSVPVCEFDGTCRPRCEYAYPGTDAGRTACNDDPRCQVSASNKCVKEVCLVLSGNETLCNANSQCWFRNGTCSSSRCYTGQVSNDACDLFPNECYFNGNDCIQTPCAASLSATDCAARDACAVGSNGICGVRPCYEVSEQICESKGCTWDPAQTNLDMACQPPVLDCIYTGYSAWSECSVNCGTGVQYKSRDIARAARPGGVACDYSDLIKSQVCSTPCTCGQADPLSCVRLPHCTYTNGCKDSVPSYCGQYNATTCMAVIAGWPFRTGCHWLEGECVPELPGNCSLSSQDRCASAVGCQWVEPNSASVSYRPGSPAVPAFPGAVIITTQAQLTGMNVIIDQGYDRGADELMLNMSYPGMLTVTWVPELGKLIMEGALTKADYQSALRNVMFMSSTARRTVKSLTWSLGADAHFSSQMQHVYRFIRDSVSWQAAGTFCRERAYQGSLGDLATVTTQSENDFLAWHVGVNGWVGAQRVANVWRWTTGAEGQLNSGAGLGFWEGGAPTAGGFALNGTFNKWDQASVILQPSGEADQTFVAMNLDGTWADFVGTAALPGFICEYSSPPLGSYGSTQVQWQGCGPAAPDLCSVMLTSECIASTLCECKDGDNPCNTCGISCDALSASDCATSGIAMGCHVNTSTLPPTCSKDVCKPLSSAACGAQPECVFSGGQCGYKTGCAALTTQPTCVQSAFCSWENSACVMRSCDSWNANATCNEECQRQCFANPYCEYVASATLCADKRCISDASCTTSLPTTNPICANVPASAGSINYQRQTAAVQLFPTTSTPIGAYIGAKIAIIDGYQTGDVLVLQSTNGVSSTFNTATGVLTLSIIGLNAPTWPVILANVRFATSASQTNARSVSYALFASSSKAGIYEPASKRLTEYVAAASTTYTNAMLSCLTRTSTLLNLKTPKEQQVASMLASGRTAWLAATGVAKLALQSEWQWNDNKIFYRGSSAFGNSIPNQFTFWGANEPIVLPSDTTLNMIMSPTGTWQVGRQSSTTADGFFCTYAASIATASNAIGNTTVTPSGCFPTVCGFTNQVLCEASRECTFTGGSCTPSPCISYLTQSACSSDATCYFDVFANQCLAAPADACLKNTTTACLSTPGCEWNGTSCKLTECFRYPDAQSCDASGKCAFSDGTCLPRLCGYQSSDACIADPNCQVDAAGSCVAKNCLNATTQADCNTQSNCQWNADMAPKCSDQCAIDTVNDCYANQGCFIAAATSKCTRNVCPFLSNDTCTVSYPNDCTLSAEGNCVRKMCSGATQAACEGENNFLCQWGVVTVTKPDGSTSVTQACSIRTASEQQAIFSRGAAEDASVCTEVTKSYTTLAILMPILTALLAIALVWIIYRQRKAGVGAKHSGPYAFGEKGGLQEKLVDYEEMEDERAVPNQEPADDLGEL